MPARNVVKTYLPNTIYHVYNRGVEKRQIFMDDQDYRVFLHCLKLYLLPPKPIMVDEGSTFLKVEPFVKPGLNLSREVKLLSYSLIPNHFHLQLMQLTKDGMTKLMRRACTCYSTYFNKRHNRVGPLFAGVYRGVSLDRPLDILYVNYYIHLNEWLERDEDTHHLYLNREVTPALLDNVPPLLKYTSLSYYLGKMKAPWLQPAEVLDQLSKVLPPYRSYQDFLTAKLSKLAVVLGPQVIGLE